MGIERAKSHSILASLRSKKSIGLLGRFAALTSCELEIGEDDELEVEISW